MTPRPTPHEALLAWGAAQAVETAAQDARQANMRAANAAAAAVGVGYGPTPPPAARAGAKPPSRDAVARARVALNEADRKSVV